MQGDVPDGSFSAAELARLEAEGAIEIHQPGTLGYATAHEALAEQLRDVDAELRAREGPDAVTSDRLLRTEAIAAEQDPALVGHAFAAWCASRGWERSDLASWLGVTVDQLAAMALEPRRAGRLAERFGADARRLGAVLG